MRRSIVIAAWLAAASANAEDPLLIRARALFNDLKFEEARAAFEQATSVRMATIDEVAAAYQGLGLVAATLGDEASARAAFMRLLAVKPLAELEGADISPRQRAPFDAARQIAQGKSQPRIEHVPLAAWPPNEPVSLHVDVTSDWLGIVHGVRLLFRRGAGRYQELSVAGKAPFDVAVPPSPMGGVEYYLEAMDEHGCPLSNWKSAESPQKVRITFAELAVATPINKRPALWIGVGAVVVAVLTIGVVTALQDPIYQVRSKTP
jgi:tetratricopeptide (TPR) repeat protein